MKHAAAVSFQPIRAEETPLQMERSLVIVFALHGQSVVRELHDEAILDPTGVFVVNPLTFYRIVCPQDAGVLCLRISPDILQTAQWPDEMLVHCYLRDDRSADALHIDLRQRCAELFRTYFSTQDAPALASQAIGLLSLLKQHFSVPGQQRDMGKAAMMERMEYVLRTIQTHWREPLSLGSLAAQQYVSESYLSRMFRNCLGMTFTEYIVLLRLEHAVDELRAGDRSVTEIAYGNGFKSVNAFISYFKRHYGTTPGQYRKQYSVTQAEPIQQIDTADWMQTLLQYGKTERPEKTGVHAMQQEKVQLDVSVSGKTLRHTWQRLLNIGYARDGLTGTVQEQIRRAVHEIGFTDLRFHGVFDDDMHIYQQNEDGSPWFNFTYADLLFDFILSVGLTPYVELGFVPSKLVREPYRLFERCSMAGMYNDTDKWEALVQAVVAHWIERYGLENVRNWHFTIQSINYAWLSPIPFSYEDYLEMFSVTYRVLKTMDSQLRLGGPGAFGELMRSVRGAKRFLQDAKERECLPDFLTIQCYPHENIMEDNEFLHFTANQTSIPSVLSKDEDFSAHLLCDIRALMQELEIDDRELIVEEWNATLWQRDLSGDTCYKAAWLTKNILACSNLADMLGYWVLSDFLDEWQVPGGVFHGGYGLFTTGGIAKAGYHALYLLTHAGEQTLGAGNGWYVAKRGNEIQIFLYHYCHYDALYRYRYQKLRNPFEAYKVFEENGLLRFSLTLFGLPTGDYRQEKRIINRTSGSSYDKWLEIGAPASLRLEDIRYISETAQPAYEICDRNTNGSLTIEATLHPHEVQMIILKKRDF